MNKPINLVKNNKNVPDDWESVELINEDELIADEDIEESENHLKLPTGRIAYFPDGLLHKEQLQQID